MVMIHFISISAVCFNESLHCHWWQRERMPYTNYYTVTEGACCSHNRPPPTTAQTRHTHSMVKTHGLDMCMCTKTTNTHFFLSFFPLAPACLPFVGTQRKGIFSVILYSFGPFFDGAGCRGLGAASAPPRFTIPGRER